MSSIPVFNFVSAQDAAKGVLAAATAAGYQGLTAIPFNRFDPDSTTWWLSPSKEYPAYNYGKIIFTNRDATPGDMLVGLYMEKGIGPSASAPYRETARGRRYLMDDSWTWHGFFRSLAAGTLDAIVANAEAEAGRPVTVVIDAGNVPVPTSDRDDVHNPSVPRDVIRFEWTKGQLYWLDEEIRAGILQTFGRPEKLSSIAESMRKIGNLDWVWVDFHAGFRFRMATQDAGHEVSNADQVWKRVCRPCRSWLQ